MLFTETIPRLDKFANVCLFRLICLLSNLIAELDDVNVPTVVILTAQHIFGNFGNVMQGRSYSTP